MDIFSVLTMVGGLALSLYVCVLSELLGIVPGGALLYFLQCGDSQYSSGAWHFCCGCDQEKNGNFREAVDGICGMEHIFYDVFPALYA